jgi:hypothetical protein
MPVIGLMTEELIPNSSASMHINVEKDMQPGAGAAVITTESITSYSSPIIIHFFVLLY